MSQHRSLKGASTITAKRNVLKRFERVELLKKRGLFKAGDKVIGLPKTKPDAALLVLSGALGEGWGPVALGLAVVAMWFAGLSSVTSASRMLFAFARKKPVERMMSSTSAMRALARDSGPG